MARSSFPTACCSAATAKPKSAAIYRARLRGIHSGTVPKFLIAELSEEILREFTDSPLIDPYDI